MIENFLTIPDAPNYEINSQLVCRNKKTGRVLKIFFSKKGSPYYSLRTTGKRTTFKRSPETLRRLAAASAKSTFVPIPSLGGRYEINITGKVRNSRTKKIIKSKCNGKYYDFQIGGNYIGRATADLLWEVHGIIRERRFRPCPCSCENHQGKFFFQNMADCARFLSPKVFLGIRTVKNYLVRRDEAIEGWKITYLAQDFNHNDLALANTKTPKRIS